MATLELDLQLMMRVKEGEAACMGPLLEAHRSRIIHFLHRMVQNQAIAEELAQEVFLRVYRYRTGYEPTAKFTAWIYKIATNLALNYRRHCSYEGWKESLDEVKPGVPKHQVRDQRPNIDQIIIEEESLGEIRGAIEALPPRQRAMVILHTYEGLEYREIAQTLGCSVPAVKSSLFRAHSDLRTRLAHMAEGRSRRAATLPQAEMPALQA